MGIPDERDWICISPKIDDEFMLDNGSNNDETNIDNDE